MSEKVNKLQGRDTIYVDTEDDITSIIEKVKKSENSVVALVPPKRIGALQSVVNLKLLMQSAKSHRKKVAIVTTDPAMTSLAAGLKIPIAKNLTEQAQILESPSDIDDMDDVIDGRNVAIGELSRMSSTEKIARRDDREDKEISAAVASIETDDRVKNDRDGDGEDDAEQKKLSKKKKIPNFNRFRKILLIGGGAAALLIAFLVWAIVFAPNGTITITTKTTAVSIDETVKLQASSATNIDQNIIQPVVKQKKESEPMSFDATGEKEIGEKAKGEIIVYNCQTPFNPYTGASNNLTLTAGSRITSGSGLVFTTSAAGTVKAEECVSGVNDSGVSFSVIAEGIGEEYNLPTGTSFGLGYGDRVIAVAKSAFTGGSKQMVKVVSQDDIEKAAEKIKQSAKDKEDQMRRDLEQQMGDSVVVLSSSFTTTFGDPTVKPTLGEPVPEDGKAAITIETTYTLIGLSKTDLDNWLAMKIKDKVGINDDNPKKIYNTGLDKATFNFNSNDYTVRISTRGAQIGAVLDEQEIKDNAVGKKAGVIKTDLENKDGIEEVKVELSPFWVSTAPSADRITVRFITNDK